MAVSTNLQDLYVHELKDLWSANDQMAQVVAAMAEQAEDVRLCDGLKESAAGIKRHTETLKSLLSDSKADLAPENCRGMEGLVKEARKHMTSDAPSSGQLRDIVMIAQYQRMSHYGIAGFGTAAAYAKALGQEDQERQLKQMVADIYKADQYATDFAVMAEQSAAVADAARS